MMPIKKSEKSGCGSVSLGVNDGTVQDDEQPSFFEVDRIEYAVKYHRSNTQRFDQEWIEP